MSINDYTKYAKINNGADEEPVKDVVVEPEVEEIVEPVIEEPAETVAEESIIEEPEVEENVEPKIVPNPKFGRVANCEKLNVRQAPNRTAPVVCELFRNAEVEIHEHGSTDDFYMIYTASGITGFCMKTYIVEK